MKAALTFALVFAAGIATSPSPALAEDPSTDLRLRVPEPRLALGATYGRVGVDTGQQGVSLGLQGRLNLGRMALVLEVGKEELEELGRTDRRVGGSAQWQLTRGTVAPYVRAGGGLIRSSSFGGSLVHDDLFGQAGAGVVMRLSPRVSFTADAVFGQRERLRWVSQDVIALTIYVPETTQYHRIAAGLLISL